MLVSTRALTVLVVAHNDSKKLLATIERIYNALAVTVEDFTIVVFDDGSTDDTLAVAKPQSYSHSTGAAAPAQPDTNTNGLG